MLTIYRRHKKSCAHAAEGWAYRRCHCPVWVKGAIGSEKIWCSLGTTDWERGSRQIRDWEAAGQLPLRAEQAEAMTIAHACEQFLADAKARNLSSGTIANYKRLLGNLERFATSFRISALSDLSVQDLTKFRGGWKLSNLTALKHLERLRSFFRFARDNGWIAENLGSKLKSPRVAPAPTLPFTKEQMTAILDEASKKAATGKGEARSNNLRLRTLILFLRYTGLRIGDAVGCPVERIADGKLRLYTQKTGTHVHLPVPEFLLKALDVTPRRSESYFFWNGNCKLQTAVTDWQTKLRDLFEDAGIPNGHAHRFRDTFAVGLLLKGVPLERISVALGHSSVKVTEKHYAPWVRERQEQVEADVRRTWADDPIVILENAAAESEAAKVTPELRGKSPRIM
ncbi:MAG TPA: tyrosine-type recombinase/integrase [Candidatus Acidoferrales bacterium]